MDIRKKLLIRNKAIATGLMIGAALLFVLARSQHGRGVWEWVGAFAEAAMIGALADWFAVVALFRHPLGLPIPHTAILRNKKGVIADNLANFIRDKFLASDTLTARLRTANPAGHLGRWLLDREHAEGLAAGLSRLLADSLDFLGDERVQELLRTALGSRAAGFDLASAAGTVIETLRNGNRHQIVLDDLLNRFALWLATGEAQTRLADAIDEMLTKEYPLLSHFIPNRDQFARGVGEKVVRRLNAFVQEVNADPVHEIRYRFDTAVTAFIARLQTDPELRGRIETLKREALHDRYIADYAAGIGADLQAWLQNDLHQPQSRVRENLTEAIAGLGSILAQNQGLRDSLNDYLERLLVHYGEPLRATIAGYISGTVQEWDNDAYASEIELSIGSDLQFIRMNGTLVGGVIGLLLHAVALLFG